MKIYRVETMLGTTVLRMPFRRRRVVRSTYPGVTEITALEP